MPISSTDLMLALLAMDAYISESFVDCRAMGLLQ
jgi:hypothetical protein